ncbi:nickel pincer cofactor biosynthesis protein LarB [Fulvivirgaceae bacterium BMA12]|uniref:Nickel pincer cofactor biosynthesis protein LarB n=1 Tax=Agaribacillus aureus TaxID=3051825 RepID=A0ABT8LJ57_9BACT|nr:nickel pincer cofactor biosynthesis protein LarB [Fulvivirgaceae bacterium BMA12]
MMPNFNIDHDRHNRLGFSEVIFGASKSVEDIVAILNDHIAHNKNALVTKLQASQLAVLQEKFSRGIADPASGIFMLEEVPDNDTREVAIVSAGTSDIHVVNEAYYTLKFMGTGADRISDVGVAGIHRLMNRLDELKTFKVLIIVAGFEGALPSVVGGLLPQPIIAVPSDVGYGVATGGQVALNAMLASCANGITVVNINNGYGAAVAATRILNQLKR